jgi:hypothetical protein
MRDTQSGNSTPAAPYDDPTMRTLDAHDAG